MLRIGGTGCEGEGEWITVDGLTVAEWQGVISSPITHRWRAIATLLGRRNACTFEIGALADAEGRRQEAPGPVAADNPPQETAVLQASALASLRPAPAPASTSPGPAPEHASAAPETPLPAPSEPPALTVGVTRARLAPVTRVAVLRSIIDRVGNVHVSDTYRTGELKRALRGAMPDQPWCGTVRPNDRFLALHRYGSGQKAEHDIRASLFVLVEIDDPELRAAAEEWGPEVLPYFGARHASQAMAALAAFAPGVRVPPPLFLTYSGGKSFHCVWQLTRPATPAEFTRLRLSRECLISNINRVLENALTREEKTAAKNFMQRVAALASKDPGLTAIPEHVRAFCAVDPSPIFSPSAMARIPCEAGEEGRFPQVGYRVVSEESDVGMLDTDALLKAAQPRLDRAEAMRLADAVASGLERPAQRDFKDHTFTESELAVALGKLKRSGPDKWACLCPKHADRNASAVVTPKGFVWCSVCNCDGTDFVAYVKRDLSVHVAD
jgi:hypothetical protein